MIVNALEILAIVAVIAGLYFLVCKSLASGGWRPISMDYLADAKPDGQQWRMLSGKVGGTICRGTLVVVIARSGLYLAPTKVPPMVFQPPVLIPWTALTRNDAARPRSSGISLTVATSHGPIPLELDNDNVAKAIIQSWKDNYA